MLQILNSNTTQTNDLCCHKQLSIFILLDKKELVKELHSTDCEYAKTIYLSYSRFAENKEPLDASKAILESYSAPFIKFPPRSQKGLDAVRAALTNKNIHTIDELLLSFVKAISIEELENDASLKKRLIYHVH